MPLFLPEKSLHSVCAAGRALPAGILFFFVLLFAVLEGRAEGSVELAANGGQRAYLQSASGVTGIFFPTQGMVRVYAKKNEWIYLASSAQGYKGGKTVLVSPTGTVYINSATNGTGFILNRLQETTGPIGGANGYTAYKHQAENEGIWTVFFCGATSSTSTPGSSVAVTSNWHRNTSPGGGNTAGDDSGNIAAFDVSVSTISNATALTDFIKGRAYMNVFGGIMWDFSGEFYGIFELLTNDGYNYKIEGNGMAGNGFTFFSNTKGYKKADGSASYLSEANTAVTKLKDPRSEDNAASNDITHKLFFNVPAADLPATAPVWTNIRQSTDVTPANNGAAGTTWLKVTPAFPVITGVGFTGNEGTANNAGVAPLNGTISFTTNQAGSYTVTVDVNNNGTDANDITLTGTATVGQNNIPWNGKNAAGVAVQGTVNASSITVSLKAGEVHFPFIDVENNLNGMRITRAGGGPATTTVYWDDSPISSTKGPSNPKTNLTGINSVGAGANGHIFGLANHNSDNFGDGVGLDTWTYLISAPTNATSAVNLRQADLESVSIAADKTNYCIGDVITYTVKFRNNGPDAVTGAQAAFNFPSEVTLNNPVTFSNSNATVAANNATATQVLLSLDMANQGTVTATITGIVTARPAGGALLSSATIMRPADVLDPDATDADNAAPADPQSECDAGVAGCNNIITSSSAVPVSNISVNGSVATISEGNDLGLTKDMTFTASLSSASPCTITVDYALQHGSSDDDDFDFTTFPKTGTLTFAPGETSKTITYQVKQDLMIEANETFTVALSGASTGGQISTSNSTGTINNDDNASSLTLTKADGQEGGANGSFTFSFPTGITADVGTDISYNLGTGTSTATGGGTDYTPSAAGTVSIPAGQNSVTLTLAVVDDALIEGTETVQITVNGITNSYGSLTVNGAVPTVNILDNDAATLTISGATITEGDSGTSNLTFNVTLSDATGAGFTVNYASADGTAIAGEDYSAMSGTLTFSGTAETRTITVPVNGDLKIEPDETFTITLSGLSSMFGGTLTLAGTPATGTILDNDNTTTNKVIHITATDGKEQGTLAAGFTFAFPAGVTASQSTTVNFSLSGGTAASGDDFTGGSVTSVVIPAGAGSASISLPVIDDAILEDAESLILTAGTVSNAGFANITVDNSPQTAFIEDNDAASIVIGDASVVEGDNGTVDLVFDVTLDHPTGSSFTVGYTVADGTATVAGNDFIPTAPGTLTFSTAGIFPKTEKIIVKVNGDQMIEANETLTVTLGSPSNNFGNRLTISGSTGSSATGTILDDDDTPANKLLTISKTDGFEGIAGSAVTFTFSLPAGITVPAATEIAYNLTGTAVGAGTDYTGAISGTVTIPAGENRVTLTLPVVDDAIVEGSETVVADVTGITCTDPAYTGFMTNNNGLTAYIQDDENTVLISSPSIVVEGNTGTVKARFTVSIAMPTSGPFTVEYHTSDGTAKAGEDYVAKTNILNFSGAAEAQMVDIDVNGDLKIEPDELFTVTLDHLSTDFGGTLQVSPPATMTILDDDNTAANKLVTISKTDGQEAGTVPGIFTVSLPAGVTSTAATTITYTLGGTAQGTGTDYTGAASGTLTIPAGQNSVSLSLPVIDDAIIEGTETVIMTITSVTNPDLTGMAAANSPFALDILDNDGAAASNIVTLSWVKDGAEPGSNPQFKVSFPSGVFSSVATTLSYSIAGTATSGADYTALPGTVTIPANQTEAYIDVPVIDDQVIEPLEAVSLTLTGAANSVAVPSTAGGTVSVNIADDDNLPANTQITLIKTADGSEPSADAGFSVSFPPGVTSAVPTTVTYTVAGTATPGSDYTALSGTVIIPANSNAATIDVAVLDDHLIEPTETVELTLTAATNSLVALSVSHSGAVSAAIADDDNTVINNLIAISAVSNGAEPGTNGSFLVSYPAGVSSSADTQLTYTISGTAGNGVDYAAISGTLILPANTNSVPVAINVTDDQVIEPSETVTLTLATASNTSFNPAVNTSPATITIADDDNVTANSRIVLTWTANGSEPGSPAGFAVSFPAGYTSAAATTVNYTVGGSATAGSDYTALSGSIQIPAGANSAAIPVTVLDDQVIEPVETIALTLTGATNTMIPVLITDPPGAVIATIADDDSTNPAANVLTMTSSNGSEPATNAGFTISFPAGISSSRPTLVNYTAGGSATAGSDYTALSGTATIPANANSVTIDVPVIDDKLIELTENVTLKMTSADNGIAALSFPAAALSADIADDDLAANNTITLSKVSDGAEPGTDAVFKISFPTGYTSAVATTVSYSIGGTAGPGSDYTALSGTVIIPANTNSVLVLAQVIDDQVIEPTETVALELTAAVNAIAAPALTPPGPVSANLQDDDHLAANTLISLILNNSGAEGGANPQFEVSFPGGYSSAIPTTVNYTVFGASTAATPGVDYTPLSGTVVIPAGANSAVINVPVIDDRVIELTETVTLELISASNGDIPSLSVQPGAVSGDIADDDVTANNTIILTRTAHGAEPGTDAGFTVSFPAGYTSAAATTVSYSVGGTAIPGSDYSALSGTVTIPANTNSVLIPVQVTDDKVIELTETVILELTGATNAVGDPSVAVTGPVSADIADDDNIPANRQVTISAFNGAEGGAPAGFVFTLAPGITYDRAISLPFTLGGQALPGSDFTAPPGPAVLLPAGAHAVTLSLPVVDDELIEDTENILLTPGLMNTVFGPLTPDPVSTLNALIGDNDNATLTLTSPTPVNEGDSGQSAAVFTVILDKATATGFDVPYATSEGTASTADNDYTHASGILHFDGHAGESRQLTVLLTGDKKIEQDESFPLNFAAPSINFNNRLSMPVNSGTAVIKNDDAGIVIILPSDGAEGGAPAGFSFRFSDPQMTADVPVQINYQLSGTAAATALERDYQPPSSGPVTIPANTNGTVLVLPVVDDQVVESDETILLTAPPGQSFPPGVSLNNAPQTAVIADNDAASFNLAGGSIPEGNSGTSGMSLTVSLTKATSRPFNVSYSVSGTTATADDDFTAGGGTISFTGALNETKTITVPVRGDRKIERDEDFAVRLLSVSDDFSGRLTLPPEAATGTIINDDQATVLLTKLADGAEPGTPARFRVSFDDPAVAGAEPVTVRYTVSGSATPGADYTALSGTVVIPAGAAEAFIDVPVIDDALVEPTETVIISLQSAATPDLVLPVDSQPASADIEDNEQVLLSVTEPTVTEGNEGVTAAVFNVRLSTATPVGFNVFYHTADATAKAAGNDYVPVNGQLNFTGQEGETHTVAVPVNGDREIEQDEFFNLLLSLSNTFGGRLAIDRPTAAGTIIDDDNISANKIISITASDGKEGAGNGSLVFSFPPGISISTPTTVAFETGGSAAGGTDYVTLPGQVIIPAGANSASIAVQVADDPVIEETETVTVTPGTASNPDVTGISVVPAVASLNILDNDSGSVSIQSAAAAEGNTGSSTLLFSVSLSAPTVRPFTLNYATADGTATEADRDYQPSGGTLRFSGTAGETQVVQVKVNGDIGVEQTEIFNLLLSGLSDAFGGALQLSAAPATGTVVNDDIAPVAESDQQVTPENIPVRFSVTANDHDADGTIDHSSLVLVSQPLHGSLVIDPEGSLLYSPVRHFNGPDQFTYTVKDNTGIVSNIATVTLSVSPENDPPVALDDSFYVPKNRTFNGSVGSNDSDIDGDPLVFTVTTPPVHGRLISFDRAGGQFVYVPDNGFSGTDQFTYSACDPSGLCDPATVTFYVQPKVTVSLSPARTVVAEGGSAELSVSITEPLFQDVEVTLTYGGTAGKGDDYVLENTPVKFIIPAGQLSPAQKITIKTLSDYLKEEDEQLLVSIQTAGPPAFVTAGTGATVIITDVYPDDKELAKNENPDISPDPLASPNGDGIGNEQFIIHNIERYPDNEVMIFNRWGNEVFHIKGYNNQDRAFAGVANTGLLVNTNAVLVDGAYFFIIHTKDSNGNPKTNRGSVIIKR